MAARIMACRGASCQVTLHASHVTRVDDARLVLGCHRELRDSPPRCSRGSPRRRRCRARDAVAALASRVLSGARYERHEDFERFGRDVDLPSGLQKYPDRARTGRSGFARRPRSMRCRQSADFVEPASLEVDTGLVSRAGDGLESIELASRPGHEAKHEIPVEERAFWPEGDLLPLRCHGNGEDLALAPEEQLMPVG